MLESFAQEFTYTFGGCTISRGLNGSYRSQIGLVVPDRINLIYTDINLRLQANLEQLSEYADRLRDAAFKALNEEAILVAVMPVYHSE